MLAVHLPVARHLYGAPVTLSRRLGLVDAVTIGLGSMIGAGIYAALGPAARAAGSGLLLALALAGLVAYCNATSSARLAAVYPASGGTYVYGRERLGPLWGHLAGWCFVVGKTASCAAMALTVGSYAWPGQERAVAVAVVALLTAVSCAGVERSARLTRVMVAITLTVLAAVVITCLTSGQPEVERLSPMAHTSASGVLQGAGLLFFAFAGYARIATLGEEVRDPARTIPRAVTVALATTFVVYAVVATAVVAVLGADGLGASTAPLHDAVRAAGADRMTTVVRAGAAVAAMGSLLALVLGVSRTTLAMARDGHLPRALARVHPATSVPVVAEVSVAVVVVALVLTTDLRGAIGFSSFGVLLYYAIANASAWTLRADEGLPARWVPVVGLLGCVLLAFSLPLPQVLGGAALVVVGLAAYSVTRARAA